MGRLLNCLFSLFVGLLMLLFAELVLRLLYSPFSQLQQIVTAVSDEREYVLKPDARIEFKGVYQRFNRPVIWQINSQGIRENKIVPIKPHNKIRIATYGDSETFGWSVDLEDTFQKRLERFDGALEVINFGIPGYNLGNVAKHLEITAELFKPSLIIYMIHPNDFEAPLKFNRLKCNSELLRRLLFLYFVIWKKRQVENRHSAHAIGQGTHELRRIIDFCQKKRIPLVLAFLSWNDRSVLSKLGQLREHELVLEGYQIKVLDLSTINKQCPKIDDHLSKEGHEMLFHFFYDHLMRPKAANLISSAKARNGNPNFHTSKR